MINASISNIATPHTVDSRVPQRGTLGFWMLFALEALFIAGVLALVLLLILPSRAPLARTTDFEVIRNAVWASEQGTSNDPLIDVAPGVSVRASSVRGFRLNDQVYYYYFEGQPSFDPLSRGTVDSHHVDVLLRDTAGPKPLVIYQITQ